MHYAFSISLILFFWMASCSVGPAYTPPCIEVPSNWKNSQDEACENCQSPEEEDVYYFEHWWEIFGDEKLNELELEALENNRDLFVAWERIEEAHGLMGIAAADLYPQLTINPLFTNTEELIKVFGGLLPKNLIRAHELLYFLPLNLNYQVDLWGQIRDQYDSATYDWEAQIEAFNGTMLTLTANLATAYYQLRAADAQEDLLLATLKTREKAFEITKARYEGEISFYSDVSQAGEEVASVQAQYYEVVRQRALLEDQVAVLIGAPASEFCLEHNPLTGLPPCIPEGIPSEVLIRRPDVAQAELEAMSENALVKRAYSLFFPSLSLTASGGSESPLARQFLKWNSRYWMIGAGSNQIVFDGFRTSSNLEAAIARFKEASGTYQQTVLIAFQEVEDSLADLDSFAKQYNSTSTAVDFAQKAYQLYLDRYNSGITYYIDVVNTERDLLAFQINLNNLRGFRFVSTIQLVKALGGGWDIDEDNEEQDVALEEEVSNEICREEIDL